MSTHIEALERMATRGTARGSGLLIRDIEESLADRPTTQGTKRRRQVPGPVWGAAVAALVLVAGLAGGWLIGPSEEVSPSGVVWKRVDATGDVRSVESGPGGFLSFGPPAAQGVRFSLDGESWARSQLPDSDTAFIESVLATRDRWLVYGQDGAGRVAWWSEDGLTWAQLDFPEEIAETIQHITATPDYFFVLSRDVFDEGTTLWRSENGETWTQIPTGPVTGTSGFLEGTRGGLMLRDEDDISVSADGITWATATLDPSADLGPGTVRIDAVEFVGSTWLAIVEIGRTDQTPVLAVLSSGDGQTWEFAGIPPFGDVDDFALGAQITSVIDDRLVLASLSNPGEVWSSADGVDWVLELTTEQRILDVAGAEVAGRPTGLWIGLERQTQPEGQDPPIVTTTAVMPDEPVDPDGLEFQATVTEDGVVRLEEFEQALEHWKTCMEEHGVTDVHYSIERTGGWSGSYASPSPDGAVETAIDNLCLASWVDQVAEELGSP